jgi:hypothetical protein
MGAKKQSPGDTPGYVYMVRRGLFYKIGHAQCPEVRARQVHETTSPPGTRGHPSVLIWSLRCKDQITAERALRMRFICYHTKIGEWFELPDEAVEWICRQDEVGICEGYDPACYRRVDY